jgi:nucleoid-associated protein YgaU
MTRETKIGLLVGLAFIIVIGILLSDQLMRSTEPPAAPLATVGDTLRKGTTTPASHHRPAPVAVTSQDVSPENEVPTKDEITRRPPPVTFVQIGGRGGAAAGGANVVVGAGQTGTTPSSNMLPLDGTGQATGHPAPVNVGGPVEPVARGQAPQGRTIEEVAARMGETLVGPDGQPLRAIRPLPPQPQKPGQRGAALASNGMKQYTVEAGDSLSRIALRQMGANTKANRDAIVKANPSLQADPDRVIIGQTYNIPVVAGTAAQAQTPPAATNPPAGERTAAPIKAAVAEYWYQVQPGDNLWKIAKEQLGDTTTVSAIKELNKAAVKNWDVLPAGTKLKLPARPVASVQ